MAAWLPQPSEVKALIPQRLQGKPFTESTVPNLAQVSALIKDVADDLLDRMAGDIETEHEDRARRAVAYETASRIELQFFPEQQRGDNPPSTQWHERAEKVLDRLQEVVSSHDPDQQTTGSPWGSFPTPTETPTEVYEPLGAKSE